MRIKIKGRIESVRPPQFNSKRLFWVINVKVDGRWQYVWRRRESVSNDVYQALLDLKNDQKANVHRKSTYLTPTQLKDCEIAIDTLSHKYGSTEAEGRRLIIEAVEQFIDRTPTLFAPYLSQCVEKFMKQRSNMVSDITMRDYKYVLNRISMVYGDRRINTIGTAEVRQYLDKYENGKRRATHIYLRSFFEYCCGKSNEFCESGKGWLTNNPISWSLPQPEYNEPEVLSFNGVIKMLMLCESNANAMNGLKNNNRVFRRNRDELIGYYIFRLFSLMRKEEYCRIVELGGSDIKNNKYIDFERKRIILSGDIYRKKGRNNRYGIGRIITPICDTFFEWLNWLAENNIPLHFPKGRFLEIELREVCKDEQLKGFNILRHTAITYHLLNFKESVLTSKIAGTSFGMIENHYLSKNIPTSEAESFYQLTPSKAKELQLIKH